MEPRLSASQNVFLNVLDTKYRAFVGGFGSGKTAVGCLELGIFARQHPKVTQGFFAPTYGAIKDIFYPTLDEMVAMLGMTCKVRIGDKEVDLYVGNKYYGTIICRSMDNPDTIVGFKIARALVDEIDVLAYDKANKAWQKIIARLRLTVDNVVNGIGVTTTPEGFNFVYNQFYQDPTESYSMVQASTYENQMYLPPDYIDTLIETYPDNLIKAYINGEFVNLESGTVYYAYDRVQNRSQATIQEGEPLYIGMDFNVTKMAATVYVVRNGVFNAVDELVDGYDTPEMIDIIDEKWANAGHRIVIYPDATGRSRKTVGASESDIGLLSKYEIRANKTNPSVKDRINATNAAFEQGRIMVNDFKCPTVASCLEQQVYGKNGEPDKKKGVDHQNDATTYPIAYEMPIVRPIASAPIKFNF